MTTEILFTWSGITVNDELHRALADAEACRQVVMKLAQCKSEFIDAV